MNTWNTAIEYGGICEHPYCFFSYTYGIGMAHRFIATARKDCIKNHI